MSNLTNIPGPDPASTTSSFSTENLCWSMLQDQGFNSAACKTAAETVIQYPYGRVMVANAVMALLVPFLISKWNQYLDRYDAPEYLELGSVHLRLRMEPYRTAVTLLGALNVYAFTYSEVVPYVYTLM